MCRREECGAKRCVWGQSSRDVLPPFLPVSLYSIFSTLDTFLTFLSASALVISVPSSLSQLTLTSC